MLALIALVVPVLAAPPQNISLEERLVATIPDGVEIVGEPVIGPDGEEWPNVHSIVWSPDGTQVAYVGITDGGTAPVVGEEVGEPWMFCGEPQFGATGGDVLFRVGRRTSKRAEKWWILLNGEKFGQEDWMGPPSFSPDGTKIAWWSQPGAKISPTGTYDNSGQRLNVAERKGKKWKIKKGKKKWQDAMSLSPLTFSADSSVVATTAMEKGQWFVVASNGRKETMLTEGSPLIQEFALGPEAKRVAACVFDSSAPPSGLPGGPPSSPMGMPPGMKGKVVYGKNEYGRRYDQVASPSLSKNGKLVAMVVTKGKKQGLAINDDKISCDYDEVTAGVFSPDSKLIAYAAKVGGKFAVVTHKTKGKRKPVRAAEFIEIKEITWSADGEHLAYNAKPSEGWHVVVGDKKSAAYDEIGPPRFSQKGDHVAFGARNGRELWWKVLETAE